MYKFCVRSRVPAETITIAIAPCQQLLLTEASRLKLRLLEQFAASQVEACVKVLSFSLDTLNKT